MSCSSLVRKCVRCQSSSGDQCAGLLQKSASIHVFVPPRKSSIAEIACKVRQRQMHITESRKAPGEGRLPRLTPYPAPSTVRSPTPARAPRTTPGSTTARPPEGVADSASCNTRRNQRRSKNRQDPLPQEPCCLPTTVHSSAYAAGVEQIVPAG